MNTASFSDEDGNYEVSMLEPSGELPKNMHTGVIPSTVDVFDPKDVLLLEANATRNPEALLTCPKLRGDSRNIISHDSDSSARL